MLRFFRTIRQRLLTENRFSKYLLYALGEIVLVMIGILLALQVNAWNEGRKDRRYERKMLGELLEDMKLDTAILNIQFRRIDRFSQTLDLLDARPGSWDDLDPESIQLFGGVYFVQNTKAVESLKASSVQVPFDDGLRKQINAHYHNARFYLDLLAMEDKNFSEFRSIPLLKSQFKIEANPDSENFDITPVPVDFQATLNSREFRDYLLLRRSRVHRWRWAYERIYASTLQCMDSIASNLTPAP